MVRARFVPTHMCRPGQARTGVLETPSGRVETPYFCPTLTASAAKGVTPFELQAMGAAMAAATTYHLALRPGAQAVRDLGGLHAYLAWEGPLLTDSGSLQALALGEHAETEAMRAEGHRPDVAPARPDELRARGRGQDARLARLDDDGMTYTSHFDGARLRLTPEESLAAQEALGADVAIALHAPVLSNRDGRETEKALRRSQAWARRSLEARTQADQALFGVVQCGDLGAVWEESARHVAALPFDGVVLVPSSFAGLPRGMPLLPELWPRHVSGVAEPEGVLACVAAGADGLDGMAPTRLARHGILFTLQGKLDIMSAECREDGAPLDEGCDCHTCRTGFARAYLHHLFDADELLGYTLASLHNLRFVLRLVNGARAAIRADAFDEFRASFLSRYLRRSWQPG